MRNIFLLVSVLLIFTYSCEEPNINDEQNLEIESVALKSSSNNHYQLYKKFALALHQAMKDHQEVRQFIKDEALKKFNGDYDILYNYISDARVAGSTFRDIIKSYYENESDLLELEDAVPSLTIFVPKLPEDSFSAENWNVAEEVPMVAVKFTDQDKVPLFSSDSDSYLLDENAIPGFPVVVLKPNERIISNANPQYSENPNRDYSSINGYSFKFLHPIFNNINPIVIDIVIDDTPDYLVDAWQIYGEEQNLGWHRDFIYYTLQPSIVNGPYIYDYEEFMRWFKLDGNGLQGLEAIAASPATGVTGLDAPELEPILVNPNNFNQGSFWTDGSFEFDVSVGYLDGSDPIEKGFPADPEDLFDIEYGNWNPLPWFEFYYIENIETKAYKLDLDIRAWNLKDDTNSNEWWFLFEEVDLETSNETTRTRTTNYNSNIGFEDGELFKFGLELGGSVENTESSEFKVQYNLDSNKLGDESVNFGDNMVISEHNHSISSPFVTVNLKWYGLRRYSTGDVSFSLIPLKVQ